MTDVRRPDDVPEYGLSERQARQTDDEPFVPFPNDEPLEPIPGVPVHLCPACDHNVAGLTALRCPACGAAFTLRDARRRGTELSEESQRDYRVIRSDRLQLFAGLGMLAAGLVLPNIVHRSGGILWLSLGMIGFVVVLGAFFTHVTFKRWTHAALVIGVISLLIGSCLCVI